MNGPIDQLRSVILNLDFHAFRQLGLDVGDPRLDALGHFAAVLSCQHHGRADDGFVTVQRRRARAKLCANIDNRHVFDQQRLHGRTKLQRQFFNFLRRRDATNGADRELLRAAIHNSATGVLYVLRNKVGQLTKGHVHPREPFRLRVNHELLFVAAAFIDLGNARHGSEQRFDRVFLDFA